MYKGTLCTVVDNSGAKIVRVIHTRYPSLPSRLASIVLVSIVKCTSKRRKFRPGLVFRALVVSTGFKTTRGFGYSASGSNMVVILKKSDIVTISKRIYTPVPLELRRLKLTKILSMGSFVYLFFMVDFVIALIYIHIKAALDTYTTLIRYGNLFKFK